MLVASVTMVIVVLLLFRFFGLLAAFVDSLGVVIKDGSDDRDHVGFNDTGADVLRASNTNVDNALESKKKTRVVIAFALPTLARFSRFTAVTLMLLRRPHSASRDSVTLIWVADIV